MKRTIFITFFIIICFPLFLQAQTKADSIECKIEGKITFKSGNIVKIQKTSGDTIPKVGAEGELSKYFESNLFGGKTTGWLQIGQMKMTLITKDILTFKLLKEESVITINGQKKKNFEIGKTVKFIWKITTETKLKTE